MFWQGETFKHWSHRPIGNEPVDQATRALLRRLFSTGDLREYRARIYRTGPIRGIRQALFMDLGRPTGEDDALGQFRGLWLVEHMNRKVFLYGCNHLPTTRSIGGTVLRDVPVLDPDSGWYQRVAKTAAARVLGLAAAARRDEGAAAGQEAALLEKVEHAILRSALTAFLNGLDSDVLSAVRAEGAASLETYNHYWNPDGTHSRNRIQAALCFPFFGKPMRTDWRLRRSIDRGDPLARELATRYHVQPRTIQQTRSFVPSLVPPEQRAILLKRLDALPGEYLPRAMTIGVRSWTCRSRSPIWRRCSKSIFCVSSRRSRKDGKRVARRCRSISARTLMWQRSTS